MQSGYVLDFTDRTFREFVEEAVNVDIHSDNYTKQGTSKANKLRTFWKIESDYQVGTLVSALIDYVEAQDKNPWPEVLDSINRAGEIAARLLGAGPSLSDLKSHATKFNANYLAEQVRRLEAAIDNDPALAIGTAKELIETCCKTILADRGKSVSNSADVSTLTKETLKELKLVPEGVPDAARGADVIKRLLSNLATIGNALAELRGLYGTGHGKHGTHSGLAPRHAKLAVGAAATLSTFLFETHQQTRND